MYMYIYVYIHAYTVDFVTGYLHVCAPYSGMASHGARCFPEEFRGFSIPRLGSPVLFRGSLSAQALPEDQ